jgi:S-adenosylmethionine-dependent methyltransferase
MIDAEVAKLYDDGAADEWSRLAVRRTEFAVTCCALGQFLPPPPAKILDVGSGPGRYAIPLAERGYDVSILDVSQQSLDLAVHKASERGINFDAVICATATDLGAFPSEAFDAVLVMGPLYHLKAARDRAQTVQEAMRVARPGHLVFSAFLTRYSVVRYAAKVRPAQLMEMPSFLESILASGTGQTADGFLRTCYCSDPIEIRPFMEGLGLATVDMVGCEGIVGEVEDKLNELPEDQFARWVALNYQLGRKPELLAASAHILHIGRKTSPA